jgi:hypothetical protein
MIRWERDRGRSVAIFSHLRQILLEHGANVNIQLKDGHGFPINLAVRSNEGMDETGNIQGVQMLLDHGADVNAEGKSFPMVHQSHSWLQDVEVLA